MYLQVVSCDVCGKEVFRAETDCAGTKVTVAEPRKVQKYLCGNWARSLVICKAEECQERAAHVRAQVEAWFKGEIEGQARQRAAGGAVDQEGRAQN